MATILVTGGAGYVGSHAVVALAAAGHRCVVLDDLSNSSRVALDRVAAICGRPVAFERADVRDTNRVVETLRSHAVGAVVHMAGLKSVEESVADPDRYHDVNVNGTRSLVRAMRDCGVREIVFSSSATVYGDPERSPIPESAPLNPANPYGRTKVAVEALLADAAAQDGTWRVALLRYFNPAGAHASGNIGEAPATKPRNLFPLLCRAASPGGEALRIFGDDFPTPDGSPVRDYLHVMDVAEGHVAALDTLRDAPGVLIANLGGGRGLSVLEVVRCFESVNGVTVRRECAPRRAGDVPAYWADASYAGRRLGWHARRPLEEMCRDAWRWHTANPRGYPS